MNHRIVLGVLIFIACAVYWFFAAHDAQPYQSSSDLAIKNTYPIETESDVQAVAKTVVIDETKLGDVEHCRSLNKELSGFEEKWEKEHDYEWEQFLEQGYDIDDVARTIGFIQGYHYSVRWKEDLLRKEAIYTHLDAMDAMDAMEGVTLAKLKQIFSGSPIPFDIKVPQTALVDMQNLSLDERKTLFEQHHLTSNDIAFFITQPSISDAEIIDWLGTLENPDYPVTYNKLSASTMLDYAVAFGRRDLLRHFLNEGQKPTNDNVLRSSLEWALEAIGKIPYGLDPTGKNSSAPDLSMYVDIVQLIVNAGGEAKFESRDKQQVELSRAYNRTFPLDENFISLLKHNYGLDVLSLPESKTWKTEQNSGPLLAEFISQKQQRLLQMFGQRDVSDVRNDCFFKLKKTYETWQPLHEARILIKQAKEQAGDDQELLSSLLSEIDPSLVSCNDADNNKSLSSLGLQSYQIGEADFQRGEVSAGISKIMEQEHTQKERNYQFVKLLDKYPHLAYELKNSQLEPEAFQFEWLQLFYGGVKVVQGMEQAGFDLSGVDNTGKPLIYYSLKYGKMPLFDYLLENNYNLVSSPNKEDVLHIALNPHRRLKENQLIETIAKLMNKGLEVDQHHLSRMRMWQIRSPQLYQQIIEKHPQLKVDIDTRLPSALCI